MQKKLVSVILALVLIFTCTAPVFAAEADGLDAQLEKTTAWLVGNYAADHAKPTVFYIARSGVKTDAVNAYLDAYVAKVKADLNADGGVLKNSYGYESLSAYALTAVTLDVLGYDPTNFEGYDLVAKVAQYDPAQVSSLNFYELCWILMAFNNYATEADAELVNAMKNAIMAKYVPASTAFDAWGYGVSVDDTQRAVSALIPFGAEDGVNEALNASLAWAKTQLDPENGYVVSWGAASSNSTGLALAMFADLKDEDAAATAYAGLQKLALDDGQYYSDYDPALATPDAYEGLVYYNCFKKGVEVYDVDAAVNNGGNGGNENENPDTGDSTVFTVCIALMVMSAAGFVFVKKRA